MHAATYFPYLLLHQQLIPQYKLLNFLQSEPEVPVVGEIQWDVAEVNGASGASPAPA